jgi:glycosyltransferase involved in cell wall biosynthesis/hypoxanthine phosphoribosyltransferase
MNRRGERRREDRISVIIPAYNAQTYLRQALESVSAQSYPHIEIIVVDDGSTDATPRIVAEMMAADSRIKLISKPNSGLADSRNRGVDECTGEWVTFLDSDDCLLPGALDCLISAAVSQECDIAVGRITRRSTGVYPSPSREVATELLTAHEAVERTLYQRGGMEPSACGKLYRRNLLRQERFRAGTWYEDIDHFYRAYLLAGRVVVVNADVYFYRCNPSGFLSTFTPGRLDVLEVTGRMEKYIAAYHPTLLRAARDRRMSANFNMLGLLSLQPVSHRYDMMMDRCLAVIKERRADSLWNPEVRIKNKLGILVSYGGAGVLKSFLRIIYAPRKRVITLSRREFADTSLALGQMVLSDGYIPDVIVGIRHGGLCVAEALAGLFPEAKMTAVDMKRPGSRLKCHAKNFMKHLPQGLLDRFRIWESNLMERGSVSVHVPVCIPDELKSLEDVKVLVVDDAVDSGATLGSVMENLRRVSPRASFRSAVLTVTTRKPAVRPDYCLYDNNILIRFPWSMDWKE